MHYLVRIGIKSPADVERAADKDDVYFSPDGDHIWTIVEAEDEESLRRDLGVEADEIRPVLPAREYMAIHEARRELDDSKARFVDDPSGALSEARKSVGRVMDARGYPPPERADEAPESRREVLTEYRDTGGDSSNDSLEDQRDAFNRLSEILDRIART